MIYIKKKDSRLFSFAKVSLIVVMKARNLSVVPLGDENCAGVAVYGQYASLCLVEEILGSSVLSTIGFVEIATQNPLQTCTYYCWGWWSAWCDVTFG